MKFALKMLSTVAIAILPLLAEAGAVDQLHQFLNSTRTLRAEFSQMVVAKNGRKPQQSSGVVAISRPGKLRWDIQKPYPQLVVGDGEKIWIYDAELKQVTVRKAGQADGMNWVEATAKADESGFEKIRLGFVGADLRAMELFDNFGQTTLIRFSRLERNPQLPATTFKFTPPAGVDVVGE